MKRVGVIGLGYVGLANALMFAEKNQVLGYDINPFVIETLKDKNILFHDDLMSKYLSQFSKNLNFTNSFDDLSEDLDFLFIALPTNFNQDINQFDTTIIEDTLLKLSEKNYKGKIIIKSTVPIGFTNKMSETFSKLSIIFSPEFLREGQALRDNLNPSRVVIGTHSSSETELLEILKDAIEKKDTKFLMTHPSEAEAIKLLSNTYLSMRVAFFNEIDTLSSSLSLSSENIIKGISLDPRIGDYYNNPSFGYGGYCLPKDTKQMQSDFNSVPQNLITATIDSNETRKKFIAEDIISKKPNQVGIYRLIMKKGSDNFRESAIFDIINLLKKANIKIIVYEPKLKELTAEFDHLVNDLKTFKSQSELIIANRIEDDLLDVLEKVYTRDIFHNN